jgi:hypothetical protein
MPGNYSRLDSKRNRKVSDIDVPGKIWAKYEVYLLIFIIPGTPYNGTKLSIIDRLRG